ncbi:MAG: hypothetical protein AB1352_00455 [Patescibacteria group bacterium]
MPDPFFFFTIIISLFGGFAFYHYTRGIEFFSTDTDNERQVYAAAQSYKWRLPSDIHKYGIGKTRMKDVTIMLVALFQKILKDKITEHPLATMCGFANAASTVLIYLIGREYWNVPVAFVVSMLFFASLWIWQVALFGGHIMDATTFFLLAILTVQQANSYLNFNIASSLWLALSGMLFCLTTFASASSRKYFMLFLAAIFYAKYQPLLSSFSYSELKQLLASNYSPLITLYVPALILLGLSLLWLSYKKIVAAIYDKRCPAFLNNIITSQGKFTLDHYLAHARKQVITITKKTCAIAIWLVGIINLIGLSYLLPVFFGFSLILILFNVPKPLYNLRQYFWYYYAGQTKGHFRIYVDFFAKRGQVIKRNMRGAGLAWVPRFFFRIAPTHTAIFCLSALYLLSQSFFPALNAPSLLTVVLLLILAVSPIAWGELTKGVQLGRSYLPGLLSILLFVGFTLSQLSLTPLLFIIVACVFLIPTIGWSSYQLIHDVYPARMASTFLLHKLNQLGIKKIYTYKTPYNDALINNIAPETKNKYEIHYINSLGEISDGCAVIPGTSSKALNLESVIEVINEGDFTKDPVLNDLLASKRIENVAVAKFKTFGTSRFWGQESEVTSYRDLILHEIKNQDLWRGYAWILDLHKLKDMTSRTTI